MSSTAPNARPRWTAACPTRPGKIADQVLRRHYEDALRDLKWQHFRQARPPRPAKGRNTPAPVRSESRGSALAQADAARTAQRLHEAVILAALWSHPRLLPEFEAQLERAHIGDPDFDRVRHALLRNMGADDITAAARSEISGIALDRVFASPHVAIAPAVRAGGDDALAATCLEEEFAKLQAIHGARKELEDALADFGDAADEGLTFRLAQAAEGLARAMRSAGRQGGGDFERAANGVRLDKAERESLDSLLARIDPSRKGDAQRSQGKHLGKK